MITPNDALQFIKDHHNGEIPYMFGKNEYARWMAEFANHTVTKHLHKLGVMQAASECALEAAVGNSAAGQSGRVGCVHNTLKYIGPWYSCETCGTHFNARAEAPSEGALPF